jgi:hypothetical protein
MRGGGEYTIGSPGKLSKKLVNKNYINPKTRDPQAIFSTRN